MSERLKPNYSLEPLLMSNVRKVGETIVPVHIPCGPKGAGFSN
jgi:hypothetical protein